jgi:ribosome-binding protein aMBF1 (putative translation factor)
MKTNAQTWKKNLKLQQEPDHELLALLETLKDDAPDVHPTKKTPNLLTGPFTANQVKSHLEEAILTSNLRDALEQARKKRGMTLRALAKKTGVSAPRVQQVEQAETKLELQTLLRHAHALGYDVSIVLTPQDGRGDQIRAAL